MPIRFGPYPAGSPLGVMTASESYLDGIDSGKNWPQHWDHLPGGPFVHAKRDSRNQDPQWLAFCDQTAINNKAWRKGWVAGLLKNENITRKLKFKLYNEAVKAGYDTYSFEIE